MPEATNIPPRLRQAYCQQFVHTLELAAEVYPRRFKVGAFTQAPSTLAARMRDTLLSMKRYSWGPELPPDMVVSQTDDGVYISGPVSMAAQQADISPRAAQDILILNTIQLEAFCELLSAHLVTGPVFIRADFDNLYLKTLEDRYNVAIEPDPANNKFILL